MNLPIETEHMSQGEKIGFGLALLGTLILLGLTIKSTIETGTVPEIEQQVFGFVFILTLVLIGGVLISHYTKTVQNIKQKVSELRD